MKVDFEVAGLKSPQPGVEQNLKFQLDALKAWEKRSVASMDAASKAAGVECCDQIPAAIEALKNKLADWAEHEDLAPYEGCQCRFCIVLRRSKELVAELTNLKEAFARLRKDRDRLQQRLVEFGVD